MMGKKNTGCKDLDADTGDSAPSDLFVAFKNAGNNFDTSCSSASQNVNMLLVLNLFIASRLSLMQDSIVS